MIFYFIEDTGITNYADANTPYTTHTDLNIAIKTLERNGNKILKWFAENCLKANTDKSHFNCFKSK